MNGRPPTSLVPLSVSSHGKIVRSRFRFFAPDSCRCSFATNREGKEGRPHALREKEEKEEEGRQSQKGLTRPKMSPDILVILVFGSTFFNKSKLLSYDIRSAVMPDMLLTFLLTKTFVETKHEPERRHA